MLNFVGGIKTKEEAMQKEGLKQLMTKMLKNEDAKNEHERDLQMEEMLIFTVVFIGPSGFNSKLWTLDASMIIENEETVNGTLEMDFDVSTQDVFPIIRVFSFYLFPKLLSVFLPTFFNQYFNTKIRNVSVCFKL